MNVANKATLSSANTRAIIAWCSKNSVPVAGEIPYHDVFRTAVQNGRTVMETDNAEVQKQLRELWCNLSAMLGIPSSESIAPKLPGKRGSFTGQG